LRECIPLSLPLEPPIIKGNIKASILVINGSEDSFLKPESVGSFSKEMVAVTNIQEKIKYPKF